VPSANPFALSGDASVINSNPNPFNTVSSSSSLSTAAGPADNNTNPIDADSKPQPVLVSSSIRTAELERELAKVRGKVASLQQKLSDSQHDVTGEQRRRQRAEFNVQHLQVFLPYYSAGSFCLSFSFCLCVSLCK